MKILLTIDCGYRWISKLCWENFKMRRNSTLHALIELLANHDLEFQWSFRSGFGLSLLPVDRALLQLEDYASHPTVVLEWFDTFGRLTEVTELCDSFPLSSRLNLVVDIGNVFLFSVSKSRKIYEHRIGWAIYNDQLNTSTNTRNIHQKQRT